MDLDIGGAGAEAATKTSGAIHRLFLSHAGIDSEAALRLARRLEESEEAKAKRLKVWIDKRDLPVGFSWKVALQSALAGLVPAFRGGRLGRPHDAGPDETIWHVVETRPGTDC